MLPGNVRVVILVVFFSLLIIGCAPDTSQLHSYKGNWSFAVGKESDSLNTAKTYIYSPVRDMKSLYRQLGFSMGVIWLKRDIILDKPFNANLISMYLGYINSNDETYLNDSMIGKTGYVPYRDGFFFQ